MEILDYLRERVQSSKVSGHPFAKADMTFKYLYGFGLSVMAYGHMKAITETEKFFQAILSDMDMPPEIVGRMITDINDNFDYKIPDVIQALRTKEQQYCFVLDLYRIYQRTLWSEDYCKEILKLYLEIFHLSRQERGFLQQFATAAKKKHNEDAKEAYYRFVQDGYDFPFSMLKYYYPEFVLEESYGDITVETGTTLRLDKQVHIHGIVRVERGATLEIRDCDLKIAGDIYVDGGRIRITDSHIQVLSCGKEHLIEVKHTATLDVINSCVECDGHCGFIKQMTGQLLLRGVDIHNTAKAEAVVFYGAGCKLRQVKIVGAVAGGVSVYGLSRLNVRDCRFVRCERDYGGAIYSETVGLVKITDCQFTGCHAKYLGAAIYFKYFKLGQYVKECQFEDYTPKDSPCWGNYEDDMDFRNFWRGQNGTQL